MKTGIGCCMVDSPVNASARMSNNAQTGQNPDQVLARKD